MPATTTQQILLAAATVSSVETDEAGKVVVEVRPLRSSVQIRGMKLSREILAASAADWVGDPVRLHKHRPDGSFLVPAEDYDETSKQPIVGKVTRSRIDDGDLFLTLALDRGKLDAHQYTVQVDNPLSAEVVVDHTGPNITGIKLTNGVALLTDESAELSPEQGVGITQVIAASRQKGGRPNVTKQTNDGGGGDDTPTLKAVQLKDVSASALLALATEAGIDGLQLAAKAPPEETDEQKENRQKAVAFDELDAERRKGLAQKLVDVGFIAAEKLTDYAKRTFGDLEELVDAAGHGITADGKTATVQASKKPVNTATSPEGGDTNTAEATAKAQLLAGPSMASIRKAQQESR